MKFKYCEEAATAGAAGTATALPLLKANIVYSYIL
jgi:hypothetical protein